MKVIIENTSGNPLPEYQSRLAAGFDLRSAVSKVVPVGKVRLIRTGLKIKIPEGYELQVRSRSGLALKNSVFVLNSPGTVDADYRGEIGIILMNLGEKPFYVEKGMRVAQGVICKCETADFEEGLVEEDTERASGGFGSSGLK